MIQTSKFLKSQGLIHASAEIIYLLWKKINGEGGRFSQRNPTFCKKGGGRAMDFPTKYYKNTHFVRPGFTKWVSGRKA
jgi:hypothetical protein